MLREKAPRKCQDTGHLVTNFSDLVLRISEFANEIGVKLKPFYSNDFPFFCALPHHQKIAVIQAATSYVDICERTKMDGGLANSKTFVWNGIKSLGLRPTSELFNLLNEDHVVEIHDFSARQMFRNFNYFKYSSYDLESLLCRDIHQLFSYDENAIKYLLQWFNEVQSGQWAEMKPFNLKPTHINELQSPFKYELKVEFLFGGPLFDSTGRPAATISLEKATIEKSAMTIKDEETLLNEFYKGSPDLRLV